MSEWTTAVTTKNTKTDEELEQQEAEKMDKWIEGMKAKTKKYEKEKETSLRTNGEERACNTYPTSSTSADTEAATNTSKPTSHSQRANKYEGQGVMPNNNAENPSATNKAKEESTEGEEDEETTKNSSTVKYPENQHHEEAGNLGEGTE